MEKNGYRRLDARRGYWKNGNAPSVHIYVKDRFGPRFRSQSGGMRSQLNKRFSRQQSKSQEKLKSELVKRVESMEMDLKETKKIVARIEEKLSKCAALDNNYVEEEIAVE